MASVGIIGGGIAGLTAAYTLNAKGITPHLFEARGRTGGVIHSVREEGFLIEEGPNALQASTPLFRRLIQQLDLASEVQKASTRSSKRYIVLGNTPVAVPRSPIEVLTTPLLSPKAKIRLLAEPLIGKSAGGNEESVAEFVQRRLGKEVLDYGINPFVAGIFAGDPEELSLPHTFPKLHRLEQNYGSLIIGHIRSSLSRSSTKGANTSSNGAKKTIPGLFTFKGGLQRLPDALASRVDEHIHLDSPVRSIKHIDDHWRITYTNEDIQKTAQVDSVVYAAPLHALSRIDFPTTVSYDPLLNVSYPPVNLMAMGFRAQDVTHPLDGFGMLVPAIEKHLRILGTLFPSSIFPDRAPEGHHLLSTFVGGARHPELTKMSDEQLQRVVCQDLNRLLGLQGDPVFTKCIRWDRAIPQYAIGYGRVMKLLRQLEKENPGLHFAGNYRQGISVGAACESGHDAATNIIKSLDNASDVNTTQTSDA